MFVFFFLHVKHCDISNSALFSNRSKVVLSDMDIENHELVTLFQKNERNLTSNTVHNDPKLGTTKLPLNTNDDLLTKWNLYDESYKQIQKQNI